VWLVVRYLETLERVVMSVASSEIPGYIGAVWLVVRLVVRYLETLERCGYECG